jgi:hypothetical protein
MQNVPIKICQTVADAPRYVELPGYLSATLTECVIVRRGTEEGRSTVDFVVLGADGEKYVVMLTGRIVRAIAQMIGNEN